jgi:hypothetical protein
MWVGKSCEVSSREFNAMRSSSRLGAAALCGLTVLTFGGGQADAGPVFAGTGLNPSPYTSVLNGIPGVTGALDSTAADFYSSANLTGTVGKDVSILGPTFKSYCVDLFQAAVPRNVDLANVILTSTTSYADAAGLNRNLAAGGWIVENYGVILGQINTSAAWKALEAAAGVNPANVTYLEQVAVTQTAVWEKVYPVTSASISGSEGGTTNADANALLTHLLAISSGKTAPIGFIDYPLPAIPGGFKNQDQIAPVGPNGIPLEVIPEPSSVALLGLGALGVAGYCWKRRKHA